ncbi:hypothetical protein OIV83_001032 [Microbotryomycetes sp. JL201]|nr:hypothetical protein OIV83_001032 [Microbotryomycetes sp. JL201]
MTRLNNEHMVQELLSHGSSLKGRPKLAHEPALAKRLPPSNYIAALANDHAKQARRAFVLEQSLASAVETPIDAHPAAQPLSAESRDPPKAQQVADRRLSYALNNKRHRTGYDSHDVLRCIEKRDAVGLMEIRNANFALLLQPVGGVTPLVFCMRQGKTHSDMAILLCGALSRRVNDITDDELSESRPELKAMLRSIRANLRIAITHGLATSDTSLLSSFLQTIIMSEGDRWIQSASHTVALALRRGPQGRPVHTATSLVNKWVGRELKQQEIASVSEYLANAAGDLVLLGCWSVVTDKVLNGEPIPLYYFARDDRILKALEERIDGLKKNNTYIRLSKQLREQIASSVRVLSDRKIGGKERVHQLQNELDAHD